MALPFLADRLAQLERDGLLRLEDGEACGAFIDACSNDYLGYGRLPVSRETLTGLAEAWPGAGASRLIHGSTADHRALEAELADWTQLPSALLFSSGYAANVGVLAALAEPDDLIVSDALNHASIIDGCRLSRATVRVYSHLDVDEASNLLRSWRGTGRRWLVTETYFSMDGDSPDLKALRDVADEGAAALIVDEAHAIGVHGPQGAGVCAENRVVPDVLVGTLGKAVGAQGAFVAGPVELRRWLWNRARSLVFSTAPSPLLARIALAHARRARGDDPARAKLRELHRALVETLVARGMAVPRHRAGPIVPVIVSGNERALHVARAVTARGFRVQAIRPPTVPHGTARLRVTLHATLDENDARTLASAIADACDAS